MPKTRVERPETLQVRVEPDLHKAVRQLAAGNDMTKSEMARALIRRGIRAVTDENTDAAPGGAVALDRDTVAARAVYLMELLESLAHNVGEADPAGAALLLRGVSHATGASVVDWEMQAKAGV